MKSGLSISQSARGCPVIHELSEPVYHGGLTSYGPTRRVFPALEAV
jgi:hypothetical protein